MRICRWADRLKRGRIMSKSKFVVTVNRQFGSMGRPIAKRMAEELGIEYYDRDLIEKAAQELDLPASVIEESEESARKGVENPFSRMQFPLGGGTSDVQDKIFHTQQNIIKFLAQRESCIIVGRCSDFILAEMPNTMHIYIYASYQDRLHHCVYDLKLEEQEARRMIKAVDDARDEYQMHYAGYLPDDKRYKDIMINSSLFGVQGTAEYLTDAVRRKFSL